MLKSYKSTLILISIFSVLLILNLISINKYEKIHIYEMNKNIKISSYNAEKLTLEEISGMTYEDKINLIDIFYNEEEYSKAINVCEVMLVNFPNDITLINRIVNIYQKELEFEKCIEYLSRILPVVTGSDLYYTYIRLAEFYLPIDINMSITYMLDAIELKEKGNVELNISEDELNFVKSKVDFFVELRDKKNDKDSFQFYEEILKNEDFIFNNDLKKFIYLQYKELYSEEYPDNFNKINAIYDNIN